MRLALLLLVSLAGCSRWTGVTAARREVLSVGLQSQRFPLRPDEAAQRMRGPLAKTTRCDRQPTGELSCGGCIHGRCFQLVEEDGATRIVTNAEFAEADLVAIWQPLDANSLTTFRAEMKERVQARLIEQEQRFVPRWGITGGLLGGLTTESSLLGSLLLGGRLGVRRWFDAHFLGHLAVEYRFRGEHELSFRVGVEMARWTDGRVLGSLGVPGISVAMFIGPLFRFSTLRNGVRTGVGFHLTDLPSAPMFIEAAADTRFDGAASQVTGTFTIGIGL